MKATKYYKSQQNCPGKEAIVESAHDLSPDTFRRLVTHRARQVLDEQIPTFVNEKKRHQIEQKILEKLHKEANFLPVRFLRDGALKASSVCRIATGNSLGTGFLIARGFLMTNNHVLSSESVAQGSVAEFNFEGNQVKRTIALEPERLFITDQELDFTIVACQDQSIPDIEPIPLLRSPATITRNESVNIIQHPRGRAKEVALHDNKVIRIMDKVIRYRTDTEPGSSGSPVFNNNWDLVALHHAGWNEGADSAINEGIRIAAIVAHLFSRSEDSASIHHALKPIFESIHDSSPYLGFFDYAGVATPDEIQVPDHSGNRDFADVGFWNIEHFNGGVSDERIERVADVVNRLSMDVLGLVEVEKPALERLVLALRDRGLSADFEVLDMSGRQDIAVLYDRETTRVIRRDDINNTYRDQLDARTRTGKSAFPRDPFFTECIVQEGNQQRVAFLMIVLHLKAFGDTESRARRRLASEKLAEIISDLRSEEADLPVVLGGDYNDVLNTDVFSSLQDSPDLLALTADDADNPDAATFVGGRHQSVIDHIIVSRDVQLGAISDDDAAIVRLDQSVRDFSDRVSDHVPVVFRIIYRDEPLDVSPNGGCTSGIHLPVPKGFNCVNLSFGHS